VPKLERLELWIGGVESPVRGPQLATILSGARHPSLRHLALINSVDTDGVLVDVANAPLAERLVSLDVTMGTLTDRGASTLISRRTQFPQLERLVVAHNRLGSTMLTALRGVFRTVDSVARWDVHTMSPFVHRNHRRFGT
jgi:hypothetical protein